jgi:predicted esterase
MRFVDHFKRLEAAMLYGLTLFAFAALAVGLADDKDKEARLIEKGKYEARAEIVEALLQEWSSVEYMVYGDQLKARGLYEKAAVFYLVALKMDKGLAAQVSYRLAGNFALWNQSALAVKWLTRAVDAGFWGYELMKEDADLKNVRTDPDAVHKDAYEALLAKVKKRYEQEAPKNAGGSLMEKPSGDAPEKGWPVILLMHGYGSNKENIKEVAAFVAKNGFIGVAVSGPTVLDKNCYRWSNDGIEETHQHLVKALEKHKADVAVDPKRVYVAGFSQGALHAVLLAASKPEFYAGAVAISPSGHLKVPETLKAKPDSARPLYLLGGSQEPAGNKDLLKSCESLWKAGKWPVKVETHDGGHGFPADWQKRVGGALKWLRDPKSDAPK